MLARILMSSSSTILKERRRRTTNTVETRERERERGMAKKPLGPTGEFFKRRDEWRKHPMLTNQFRHATPGLGIALVAFGVYLVGEQVYKRILAPSPSHHQHQSTSAASHWGQSPSHSFPCLSSLIYFFDPLLYVDFDTNPFELILLGEMGFLYCDWFWRIGSQTPEIV